MDIKDYTQVTRFFRGEMHAARPVEVNGYLAVLKEEDLQAAAIGCGMIDDRFL